MSHSWSMEPAVQLSVGAEAAGARDGASPLNWALGPTKEGACNGTKPLTSYRRML